MNETIYFQPHDISPEFCEAGSFLGEDTEYIHYYDEPCKIHVSAVKIIPKEKVYRQGNYLKVKQ